MPHQLVNEIQVRDYQWMEIDDENFLLLIHSIKMYKIVPLYLDTRKQNVTFNLLPFFLITNLIIKTSD